MDEHAKLHTSDETPVPGSLKFQSVFALHLFPHIHIGTLARQPTVMRLLGQVHNACVITYARLTGESESMPILQATCRYLASCR